MAYQYLQNEEKRLAHNKRSLEYHYRNREKQNARRRLHNQLHKEERRIKVLFEQYGLTVERHNELLASQDYKCAICKADKPGGKHNTWNVDHDHNTKKVRGLLCKSCNVGIGNLQDDINILKEAIKYLEKYK